MTVSVEDFLKECKQKGRTRSEIEPFQADIRTLLSADISVPKIQEFLKRNGVVVSLQAIYQYIERHHLRKSITEPSAKTEKKKQVSVITPNQKSAVSTAKSQDTFTIDDTPLSELI